MEDTRIPDEVIRRARNVSLEHYLPYKGYSLGKRGAIQYNARMVESLPGVHVRGSLYVSKEGIGGDAIKFCREELRMSFREAVYDLIAFDDLAR